MKHIALADVANKKACSLRGNQALFFLIIKNPGLQFDEPSVFQDWFKKMIRLFCDATFTFSDAHATDLCSVTWVWSPPFGFLRAETGLNVCSKCADEKIEPLSSPSVTVVTLLL